MVYDFGYDIRTIRYTFDITIADIRYEIRTIIGYTLDIMVADIGYDYQVNVNMVVSQPFKLLFTFYTGFVSWIDPP